MRTKSPLLFVMPFMIFLSFSICANERGNELTLNVKIVDEVLVADLLNNSSIPILVVSGHQSIDADRMSGFFLEINDRFGEKKSYCGMLDQGEVGRVLVQPHESLLFKIDTWVIAESHCLKSGNYRIRVVYVDHIERGIKRKVYSNSLDFSANKVAPRLGGES